jgi:hypothetical protein
MKKHQKIGKTIRNTASGLSSNDKTNRFTQVLTQSSKRNTSRKIWHILASKVVA